ATWNALPPETLAKTPPSTVTAAPSETKTALPTPLDPLARNRESTMRAVPPYTAIAPPAPPEKLPTKIVRDTSSDALPWTRMAPARQVATLQLPDSNRALRM